ncbi:hypothetical protein J1N35_021034, partial [Gossypium stocksii]
YCYFGGCYIATWAPNRWSAITGVSTITEAAALCYKLLRVSFNNAKSKFAGLRFSWLIANFEHLSINATEHEEICAARAYIMHIIGGILIPGANNNKNVRSYSWGSKVLAILYCELCQTTKSTTVDIGGCILLLQSWALFWIPFLASMKFLSVYRESSGIMGIDTPAVWLHPVNNYFPSSSGHEYHFGFDIFSPVPPQYSSPLGPYPPHYSIPLKSHPS